MMIRLLGLVTMVLLGCSGPPDPIVGTWTFGTERVELRDSGAILAPPLSTPACEGEAAAIAACGSKHKWQKQGSYYRITMMTLARPAGAGSFNSMFDEPKGSGCQCVPDIVGIAELVGDELVIDGKQHGRRVKR